MKFIALFSVLALMASSTNVKAQLISATNRTAPPGIPSAQNGPFSLTSVYPLWKSPRSGEPVTSSHCAYSPITNKAGHFTFSGSALPVHITYYGTGFTTVQKGLIENFLDNIGSTNYWKLVTAYVNNGLAGATPKKGSIWSTGVITNEWYGLNGIQFAHYNEQALLNYGIDHGLLPNQKLANYAIFLGTNIIYTTNTGSIMGESVFCGTHSVSGWGSSTNFAYFTVQLPKSPSSTCNVVSGLGNAYPNNDYAVDNLITIATHELVESIISPYLTTGQTGYSGGTSAFSDQCSNEPADKCTNMFLSVGTYPNNGNIQVGGQIYVVFPLYDIVSNKCAMVPQAPAPTCGNGNIGNGLCANGLCCTRWGWCGTC